MMPDLYDPVVERAARRALESALGRASARDKTRTGEPAKSDRREAIDSYRDAVVRAVLARTSGAGISAAHACLNRRCGACGWLRTTPPRRERDPICPGCHRRRPPERVREAKARLRSLRSNRILRRRLGGARRAP